MNDNQIIVIGFKSRIASLLFKYPWVSMILSVIILELVIYVFEQNSIKFGRATLVTLPILTIITAFMQYYTNGWCYKIDINCHDNIITFYQFFNRGIKSHKVNNIIIVIGAYCNIYIDNAKYVIDAAFIHDLVSYLPKDTKIEYKGRGGKYTEKDLERRNKPLVPGSKLL